MDRKLLHELIEDYTSAMNEVNRRISAIMNDRVHEELTGDQFLTMRYIQKNEPCTSSDIANEFGIVKSAVTAQVNRLYEKGLIERDRDSDDRRIVYLRLTTEGKTLMKEGTDKLYEVLGEILSNFDKEEMTFFIWQLQKLARILKENG
ncbi:DNA-binding MarR family transcriptional regulator [Salirhabdus euzebyi]|uniref:DNA-binding MarR family transcriptional regulator n=1 Tax=Salirhabdus euzebyi TaxID=394506 RepID=A0A841QA15_9BACI|nr:MarR family transcriptional regulator [Salirhabdus euzebyi]MBB6455072.1 DNA-binding MarR family transcriptional regulator [Salirhabdus euzebyi]